MFGRSWRMKRRDLYIIMCPIVVCQLFVRPAIQVKIPLTRQYETLAIEFCGARRKSLTLAPC